MSRARPRAARTRPLWKRRPERHQPFESLLGATLGTAGAQVGRSVDGVLDAVPVPLPLDTGR